jgi:hypothetical protein
MKYEERCNMKIRQIIFLIVITLTWICSGYGQEPRKTEDPNAKSRHAARGSDQERARFEEHGLPSEKAQKDAKQAKDSKHTIAVPADGEVTDSLSPGERPALRLLKKKQDSKAQHQNRLENPHARNPNEFTVEYNLENDAEVSVTIVGSNGVPVRHYTIPPGQEGGRKGKNRVIYWDGQDLAGRESPPGRYFAFQSIRYESKDKTKKAKRETKMVPLHKKEK